ncbi:MAG: metallophosphoesterase [Gammaproteobacteria bacterium]|nr:metallophosphoesterase [Gammaproteobacteria bacterium]
MVRGGGLHSRHGPGGPGGRNHEYARLGYGDAQTDRILSILWRPQFTLPREPALPSDLQEAAYALHYSEDVHVFVLSTQNSQIAEQAEWLDAALENSDARWKIVSMHHPIFSSGRGRDSPERRALLLPVLERHSVDLVLQGHDHTYARGATGQRPERLGFTDAGGDVEVMFVNSVAGPKQYSFVEDGWDRYQEEGVVLARKAENTQFFQIIEIDDDELRYQARTALGHLYDDFVMRKADDGSKTIVRGATSTMDERTFETTGPYADPDALK